MLPPVPRYWASEKGLDKGEATDEQRSRHGDAGVVNLLTYDRAKLEAVHAVARRFAAGGWTLSEIHPFEREPMFAAVEFSHPDESVPAYLVVCSPSMMETEAELTYRIEATTPGHAVLLSRRRGILSLRRARLHWHRRMGCRSGAGPGHRAPVRMGASRRHYGVVPRRGAMPTTGASPPEHPSWTARRPPGSPYCCRGFHCCDHRAASGSWESALCRE